MTEEVNKKNSALRSTMWVVGALVLGILFGAFLNQFQEKYASEFVDTFIINGVLSVIGGLFSNAIRMMVVPLVFLSITLGAASMVDLRKFGRIGFKLMALYIGTTCCAVTIGLVMANIMEPGVGFDLAAAGIETAAYVPPEPVSFADQLISIIPTNPIQALADGNMLQIIFMAVFLGVVMAMMPDKSKNVRVVFEELEALVVRIIMIIMKTAPLGVFALISVTFATNGLDTLASLLSYSVCLLLSLFIQVAVVYSLILLFSGVNPIKFFKKCIPVWAVAFSTSSSSATLPVTMDTLSNEIGVKKEISGFTLPLGATMNMDGTAIMQGVAIVFFAQILGVELTIAQLLGVVLVCTLASIGTAAVPSGGIVVLSMILPMLGFPVELLALILSVDRLLDMTRTCVNVTGDMTCTVAVAKTEGGFDSTKFAASN